jgi:hypothetical protein
LIYLFLCAYSYSSQIEAGLLIHKIDICCQEVARPSYKAITLFYTHIKNVSSNYSLSFPILGIVKDLILAIVVGIEHISL